MERHLLSFSYGKINKNGGGTYQRTNQKSNQRFLLCIRRRRDLSNKRKREFPNRKITPLVGDQVIFESENQTDGYLLEILPRKNQLVRPPVTNVDLGIIVTSIVEPAFSYNLLDRFLVTLEYESMNLLIFLTKTDLSDDRKKSKKSNKPILR